MPRTPSQVDQSALYEAALEGLELQKKRIEEQIQAVRSILGGKKPRGAAKVVEAAEPVASAAKKAGRKPRKKRNLSPEARKRIAEAQRKRWAAFREGSEG